MRHCREQVMDSGFWGPQRSVNVLGAMGRARLAGGATLQGVKGHCCHVGPAGHDCGYPHASHSMV